MWINSAQASTTLNANFEASKTCEAFQSFKKQINPGNIKTDIGTTYQVKAIDTTSSLYYLIVINTSSYDLRWVSSECGILKIPNTETSSKDIEKNLTYDDDSVYYNNLPVLTDNLPGKETTLGKVIFQGTHGSGGGVND